MAVWTGHHSLAVQGQTPEAILEALAAIHEALGGDAQALATKRRGNSPTPDLVHAPSGVIVEVDEVQHFTSARLLTFENYPPHVRVGFDIDEYRDLISRWRVKGDRAYAHKVAADFPKPGGRQAQRAYNDALRDLLAPTFTGQPVVRLPVPDRNLDGIEGRLQTALSTVGRSPSECTVRAMTRTGSTAATTTAGAARAAEVDGLRGSPTKVSQRRMSRLSPPVPTPPKQLPSIRQD